MMHKNLKTGFSLVEVMIIFTIIAVIMAAAMPVITRRTAAPTKRAIHGAYICMANGVEGDENDTFTEVWYDANHPTRIENQAGSCTFTVPDNADSLRVILSGAGSGGRRYADYRVDNPNNYAFDYTLSGAGIVSYGAQVLKNRREGRRGNPPDIRDYMQIKNNDAAQNTEFSRARMSYIPTNDDLIELLNGLPVSVLNGTNSVGKGGKATYKYHSPAQQICVDDDGNPIGNTIDIYKNNLNAFSNENVQAQLKLYCMYNFGVDDYNPNEILQMTEITQKGGVVNAHPNVHGSSYILVHNMVRVNYNHDIETYWDNQSVIHGGDDNYPFITYLGYLTNLGSRNGGKWNSTLIPIKIDEDDDRTNPGSNIYLGADTTKSAYQLGNGSNENRDGEDAIWDSSDNQNTAVQAFSEANNYIYAPQEDYEPNIVQNPNTRNMWAKFIKSYPEYASGKVTKNKTDGKYVETYPGFWVPLANNPTQSRLIVPPISRQTPGKGGVLSLDKTNSNSIPSECKTFITSDEFKNLANLEQVQRKSRLLANGCNVDSILREDYSYKIMRGVKGKPGYNEESAPNGEPAMFHNNGLWTNTNVANGHELSPFRIVLRPGIGGYCIIDGFDGQKYRFGYHHHNLSAIFTSRLLGKVYRLGQMGNPGTRVEATFNGLPAGTQCEIFLPKGGRVWDVAEGTFDNNGVFNNPSPPALSDARFQCRAAGEGQAILANIVARSGQYKTEQNSLVSKGYTYRDIHSFNPDDRSDYFVYGNNNRDRITDNGVYFFLNGSIVRFRDIRNNIVTFMARVTPNNQVANMERRIRNIGKPGSATNLQVSCLAPKGTVTKFARHYLNTRSLTTQNPGPGMPNDDANTLVTATGVGPLRTLEENETFDGIQNDDAGGGRGSYDCYQNDAGQSITNNSFVNGHADFNTNRTYHIGRSGDHPNEEPYYILQPQGIRFWRGENSWDPLHRNPDADGPRSFNGGGGGVIITW